MPTVPSTARAGADIVRGQSASRPLARGRVQIARIWGIGISVHASWLIVFALVTWSLAAGYFPTGNVLGGVWLLLIGWFLENAAASTEAEAGLRALLHDVTVAQAITRECSRVAGDRTLGQLVREEVLGAGRRCFLVTDEGRLAGLVTLHQIKQVSAERRDTVRVDEVMTPVAQLAVVRPDDSMFAALQRMDDGDVAQLPVIADGKLLGLIGREEILHYVRARAELGV